MISNYDQTQEMETVELWNRCCFFDPITVKKFRLQTLLDLNFRSEMAWTAVDDGHVVGFAYGTKRIFPYMEKGMEETRGWVNVLCVDPAYRRKGIGHQLYKNIEEQLKNLGAKTITLGAYSPNYYFYGLDPDHYPESIDFFENEGYHQGEEHYSMGMDLHGYTIPRDILKDKAELELQGFHFLKFNFRYCTELLEFIKNEFGGGWKRDAMLVMQNGRAEEVILIVLNPQGRICGFCMSEMDGNPMRFGPIGVSKEVRNKNIGSILLCLKCYEMEKQGIYHMYFMTTEKNARRYYEKNGLTIIRRYIDYRKQL